MSDYVESPDFIEAFFKKDPRAIKALFEKFYQSLHSFSYSITGDDAKSVDIVTESLLKLYAETGRFEPGNTSLKNIRYFLFLLVRNSSLNYLKSRDHTIRKQTVEVPANLEIAEAGIDHIIIQNEKLRRIYQALKKLPKERRRALELLYYEGRSYEEAAKIMGVSLGMFKNYRKYAVAQMKEYLDDDRLIPALTTVLISACLFPILKSSFFPHY